MTTTAQQLAEANAALEEAQAELDSYRAAASGDVPGPGVAERLLVAQARVRAAAGRVHVLGERLAAEETAQADRDAREQAARPQLDKGAERLEARRQALAEAVQAAAAALAEVHAQAAAYGAEVEAQRVALAALGLTDGLRPDGEPHAIRAEARGVVLGGRGWRPVDPAGAMLHAARAAIADAAGPHHPIGLRLRGLVGLGDAAHLADLLRVAEPAGR